MGGICSQSTLTYKWEIVYDWKILEEEFHWLEFTATHILSLEPNTTIISQATVPHVHIIIREPMIGCKFKMNLANADFFYLNFCKVARKVQCISTHALNNDLEHVLMWMLGVKSKII